MVRRNYVDIAAEGIAYCFKWAFIVLSIPIVIALFPFWLVAQVYNKLFR